MQHAEPRPPLAAPIATLPAPAGAPGATLHTFFGAVPLPPGLAAFAERNYRLYFFGQFSSQAGNAIEQTAVAWLLYQLTDSPLLLGMGGFFRAAPSLTLFLLGGAVADRLPRRPLLLCTEGSTLLATAVVAALTLSGHLAYWHLYLLTAFNATLSAFSVPARQALFPALVPRDKLASAVTTNSIAVRSATLAGPAIAGTALAVIGPAGPFLVNVLSYSGMLLALVAMRLAAGAGAPRAPRGERLSESMLGGMRFIAQQPILRVLVSLDVLTALFGYSTAMVTIVARDVLQAGPQGLGGLLSAFGAGALVGILLLLLRDDRRRGRLILAAGAAYCLLLAGFGLSPWYALSVGLMFATGITDSLWSVTRNTVLQLSIPDALRGRVMSLNVVLWRGVWPAGQVLTGALAGVIGAPATIVLGAALVATGLATVGLRAPVLRRFGAEDELGM